MSCHNKENGPVKTLTRAEIDDLIAKGEVKPHGHNVETGLDAAYFKREREKEYERIALESRQGYYAGAEWMLEDD